MQCLNCGNDFDYMYECPVCSQVWRKSGRFNRIFTKIEDILLEFFLAAMILMVLAQILMRNVYQTGILGGDDLIRHLVLWIAFFGAGIATRSNSHVKIDVVTNFVKEDTKQYMNVIVNVFSFIVCGILTVAACQFLYSEYHYQEHSQFLNLPLWVMEIVMPLGYLIISLRFALNSIFSVKELLRGKTN